MVDFGDPSTWEMNVDQFIDSGLPKEKPQELLDLQEQNRKQRLLQSLQRIGGGLEDSSLDFINRENFANQGLAKPKRGLVDEPGSYAGDYGPNISEYKSGGKQLGYHVRTRKVGGGTEKAFSINKYGSLDKALEAAKKYRKNFLGDLITNEDYLKLRNKNKEMSTSEFSKYLQEETTFKPRKGKVFDRNNVKNRDQDVGFESTRIKKKRTLGPKIEEEIYKKYLKRIKDGKAEGTIIGLGRDYLPGETRSTQEKTISRILREKGVDRSPFKKVNINNKKTIPKDQKRRTILFEKKKRAGSSAGQLSDEIILDIKAMNKKVENMSLEDIAANKKYINSMRINATMDNLSKGVIPFDKYKELSDLEVAGKIKDRAKANKFFDVEHISSVKGQKTNIYYPNNIQMAPGQFGSLMDNFKRIADEQPNNAVLSEVDKILSDYGLTVRNPKNNVRLGNKNVIEVTDGMSNIVQDNFNSIDTPFEKQTITKATTMRGSSKKFKPDGPTLGMNAIAPAKAAELADFTQLPKDFKNVSDEMIKPLVEKGKIFGKKSAGQILSMARPAAKLTGLELLFGSAFAPFDIGEGRPMKDVALNVATLGLGVPIKDARRVSAFADRFGLKEDLFTAKSKLAGANKIRGDQKIEFTDKEQEALRAETYFKEKILQPELDQLLKERQSESDPYIGLDTEGGA